MARDSDSDGDGDAQSDAQLHAPAGRPPLSSRSSDSHSDTTTSGLSQTTHHHHQQAHRKPQHLHHKPNHGRVHARVASSKALHKQHAPMSKAVRRAPSPSGQDSVQRPAHRRAISDYKPQRQFVASHLPKSTSQTNIKRNRSSIDIGKRNKSTDKLKRTSSGTGIHRSNKSQVHFDLGNDDGDDDDQDGEWVDASGSNSPYLSRKGSLNSSAQSSLRPGPHSNNNSRPETPNDTKLAGEPAVDRERVHHKEYITSRLLQRAPSRGAPPQMTADMAQATPPQSSPPSIDQDTPPPAGSNPDELTSRFVDVPNSGVTSEGSFYHHSTAGSRRSEDLPRRPNSMVSFSQSHGSTENALPAEKDNSALVPKAPRRTAPPAAQTSRTQQKLNLQRASSAIEPGQSVASVAGVTGANPLIGVGGPGHDGGNSRDPRVGRLLERTGMEYLVVRRYQNAVARSLNRVARISGAEKAQRIPRPSSAIPNGKRAPDAPGRHLRNVSMPDPRQTLTPSRTPATTRSNGTNSSFDGDEVGRLGERLSGASLVDDEGEENGVPSLLRNMWEKPLDLSASTD